MRGGRRGGAARAAAQKSVRARTTFSGTRADKADALKGQISRGEQIDDDCLTRDDGSGNLRFIYGVTPMDSSVTVE